MEVQPHYFALLTAACDDGYGEFHGCPRDTDEAALAFIREDLH